MKYVPIFPDVKLANGSNKKIYSKFRAIYISLSLCSISLILYHMSRHQKNLMIIHHYFDFDEVTSFVLRYQFVKIGYVV